MAPEPQFLVTFRGMEIGRYETAERAMAAARSVIDTELGALRGQPPGPIPAELPRIEWQPPRVPFPFDAAGYWHWRAQAVTSERRPPSAARPVPPPPEAMLPRGREHLPHNLPATVYGGPPPRPEPPAPTVITPVYDGPPPPVGPPPVTLVYGGPPPPEEPEESESGRRRWFGKRSD